MVNISYRCTLSVAAWLRVAYIYLSGSFFLLGTIRVKNRLYGNCGTVGSFYMSALTF
jgi:hypothetical protein